MPTVAELVFGIVYGAPDKGPLDKAVDDARKAADKASAPWVTAGKTVAAGVAGLATATVAAGAGLFALADRSTKALDAVAKGARNAGIASAEYQKLAHAAGLADVDAGVLTRSIQDLNRNIANGENAPKGFREALQSVGLTMNDLGRGATEDLGTIFDALNRVENESQRSGLAVELLGRAGRQMGSLIAGGSDELRAMGDEAERLGLVFSDEALTASESFQDSLTRMESTLAATAATIGVEVAPEIEGAVNQVTEWTAANKELLADDVAGFATGMASALTALLPIIGEVASALGGLAEEWASIIEGVQLTREEVERAGVDPGKGGIDLGVGATLESQLEAADRIRDDRQRAAAARSASRRIREGRERAAQGTLQEQERQRVSLQRRLDAPRERAARATLREQERLLADFEAGKRGRQGGGGRRRKRAVDFEAEDFELLEAEEEFGSEIDVFARSVGATAQQRQLALEAASSSSERGASRNVALRAAQSQLESLTGGKVRTTDRSLSDLLGRDVPDIELSALARGAEPQVLVSNIYNTFTFTNDIDVDGVGDPAAVAHRVVDAMRDTFQGQIQQATKTVKVDFAR